MTREPLPGKVLISLHLTTLKSFNAQTREIIFQDFELTSQFFPFYRNIEIHCMVSTPVYLNACVIFSIVKSSQTYY